MPSSRPPTRQRIVNTAFELFAQQGIAETTTRQIADRADINEVTLFRHFGSKHGLLLAVLQECLHKYLLLTKVGESLTILEVTCEGNISRFLRYYIQSSLEALENVPELMRSLVGEAGQFPIESRQALAQGITQVNQSIASALRDAIAQTHVELPLPPLKLANLVNTCILGYAVVALTSDAQAIWASREDFIATLVELIARDTEATSKLADIPEDAVRGILLQAKRQSPMDYAIAYLLFGAGLTPEEIANLSREDFSSSTKASLLRVRSSNVDIRSVPINQKILGHRYGSAHHNPLTNYLKGRKDDCASMFAISDRQLIRPKDIQQMWLGWTQKWTNPDGSAISIQQARHTWGVEMLMRGMDADNFRIISGLKSAEVRLYQRRVKEKVALEQAIALDA